MKQCTRCKSVKELSSFYKMSSNCKRKSKDGYSYHCRTCDKLNHYKDHDSKRNLKCDLTAKYMDEHILNQPCTYCGDIYNIGCDRIDNTKGHTMDNVVPCCSICNKLRIDEFSVEEMKNHFGPVVRLVKQQRLEALNNTIPGE